MGRFPSGQREQTVNLPLLASVVRIHPCPPSSAGMAELADAHDSGSCVRTYLQVQVLFPAQTGSCCKSTASGFFMSAESPKIPKKSLNDICIDRIYVIVYSLCQAAMVTIN